MIYAKDKEQAYRIVPEGTYYYGMTLVDGDIYRVLMWNDLLGIEGTDRIVKMTFRLVDVTIKGSGLIQLIRDAKTPRENADRRTESLVVRENAQELLSRSISRWSTVRSSTLPFREPASPLSNSIQPSLKPSSI